MLQRCLKELLINDADRKFIIQFEVARDSV